MHVMSRMVVILMGHTLNTCSTIVSSHGSFAQARQMMHVKELTIFTLY
jgi:hypothetical protein